MPAISSILIALGIALAVGALGFREHRTLRAARRGLLDECADVLAEARLDYGGDDFPRLSGRRHDRAVRVELIPDTMTIRRLPQLWLSVTVLEKLPAVGGLAILARPAGTEFYSLTASFHRRLAPPVGFPAEVLMRGADANSQRLLDHLAVPLGAILTDPRVKEIAVTWKGLRIIRQAGEGRRGEHLLLRQAMFDRANVSAGDLEGVLASIETLRAAVALIPEARAA